MKNLINKFCNKSVIGILAVFHKAVAELEALAEAKHGEAMKQMRKAEEADAKAEVALAEVADALSAISGIKSLLSGGPVASPLDTPEAAHQEEVGAP